MAKLEPPSADAGEFRDGLPEHAHYPCGGGDRHRIGMRFALMETKPVLATLLRQFRLTPVTEPPLDLTMRATHQPAEPIEVGLERR